MIGTLNGPVDLRGVNLTSVNLNGSDLSTAQFSNDTVFSDGFTGVNLSGTNAMIGTLSGPVDLRGVNLTSVNLNGSDLSTAQFSNDTVFSDGFTGVNLSGTNAMIGTLNGPVDLRGVNLTSVNLNGSDLSTAQFSNDTVFSDGFTGVNLSGTNAMIGTLSGPVDLRGVNLTSVNLNGSDLSTAQFSNDTVFSDGFTGVNLSGTNAMIGTLSGPVDLRGVKPHLGQPPHLGPTGSFHRSVFQRHRIFRRVHRSQPFRHQRYDRHPLRSCRPTRGQPHLGQPQWVRPFHRSVFQRHRIFRRVHRSQPFRHQRYDRHPLRSCRPTRGQPHLGQPQWVRPFHRSVFQRHRIFRRVHRSQPFRHQRHDRHPLRSCRPTRGQPHLGQF